MFLCEKQVLGVFILLCTAVKLDYSFSSSYVSVHTNGDSSNLQHDHHYVCGVDTVLICVVINDNANGLEFARWVEYSNGHSTVLTDTHFSSGGTTTIQYKLDNGGYYSCQYNKYVQFSKYAFNLTVEVGGTGNTCINLPVSTSTTSSTTTTSTTTTTSSTTTTTSTTTTIHTTSSTNVDASSTSSHFKGFDPLIYTVASALLLGILTLIVSIIICWLRSHKNTRQHTLLSQENPQDYLDYIQKGQFTPLTTSESIASFREQPPTCNEGQNMERQIQHENESTDATHPHNPNSIWTPLEEPAREAVGNLEGEIDTSSSDERLVNEDHILQDVTLSFLLAENSYQNPPPPSNNEELERQEDEVCNDTETTNLLVGAIPSLDAVV